MAAHWVFFVTWDADQQEWSADLSKDRRTSGPLPVVIQRIGEAGWRIISAVPQRTHHRPKGESEAFDDVVSYAVFTEKDES